MLLSLQEWNAKLASLAKERASTCDSEPPAQNASSHSHLGWNTNISALGVSSFPDVLEAWFEEGESFFHPSGKCNHGATCHHYTQVRPDGPPLPSARRGHVAHVVLFFCSWCGPPPDGWAVPVSCVQDKENSGKCLSVLISLGNCTVYPQINTVLCNSQVFSSHIHTLSGYLVFPPPAHISLITSLLPKAF